MRIDAKDKVVHVSKESLVDPETAHREAVILLSVMLYPEQPEKYDDFTLEMQNAILDSYLDSREDREAFFLDHPKLAAWIAAGNGGHPGALDRSIHSRKAGLTGSLAIRGTIAGQLLTILVDSDIPRVTTLNAAYKWYIGNFQAGHEVKPPTKSLLKSIWGEFKHVSHLWAAWECYKTEYDKVLFQGFCNPLRPEPDPQAPVNFNTFLHIATYFRNQLLDLVNSSTGHPLIEDPFKAWNILAEDKKPFPPAQPSQKKNQ